MKIVIFGLAITSSWGNGHGTTYRSLCKALARRGHQIHFVEKDLEWYRNNRDLPNPEFCTVHHYRSWKECEGHFLRLTRDTDVTIMGSYFPDAIVATTALIEAGRGPLVFYDIDTPVTIEQLRAHGKAVYLEAAHIPYFAAYLSFTGGPVLRELEEHFGAKCALPFYCSVDPELYRPTHVRAEFQCDLSYLGTYAADRQPKLMHLLNEPAKMLPQSRFIVAGAQYPNAETWAPNVERVVHIAPPAHPAFYSSARFTLNLTRDSMVSAGFSPSVRLFEASACGAAIVSDSWEGLDQFLTPGREVLLPKNAQEVAYILRQYPEEERVRMALNARERVLAQHTSSHRAQQFEEMLSACGSYRRKTARMQTDASTPTTAAARTRRAPVDGTHASLP